MLMKLLPSISHLFFIVVFRTDAAIILTFDPPALHHGSISLNSYTESGIIFTGSLSGSFIQTDSGLANRPDDGSAHLDITRYYTQFKFSDNRLFRLDQLDIAEYSTVFASPQTVTLTGYGPNNSLVKFSFITDGIIDGTGPLADFQTVSLPPTFSGLQRVEFSAATFSIDNLIVTPVPESGTTALVLFGATAVCASRMRRHQVPDDRSV